MLPCRVGVKGRGHLLGWPLKPLPGFAEEPAPLGAVLDLSGAACGEIIVKNRPERVAELVKDITEFTDSPEVSLTRLLKLRGRILFSRSLCFGRFAASALKAVNAYCAAADACGQRRVQEPLVGDLRASMLLLAKVLRDAPPRCLKVSFPSPPIILTDAAFELASGQPCITVGGALLDRDASVYEFFGLVVTAGSTAAILEVTQNPIAEAEALAVAVTLHAWRSRLQSRAVLGFVDNEGARQAIVKGCSSSESLANCVDCVTMLEIDLHLPAWWERVPSKSNLGDPPSRGIVPPLLPGWPMPCCTSVAAALQHLQVRIASQCSWEGWDVAFLI